MPDFLDMSLYQKRIKFPRGSGEAKLEPEDYNNIDLDLYEPLPIIRNFEKLVKKYYEEARWYYLVFAPMDKPYMQDQLWFDTKGIDACRKKVTSSESFFIVKEKLNCPKVHINALVLSKTDLSDMNGKIVLNRYRIYAEPCSNASHVLTYMTKEFKQRDMILFHDYLYKNPCSLTIAAPSSF